MKKLSIWAILSLIIQLNVAAQYFEPAYSGNPYNPMSFLVLGGSIDGFSLQAGDEIAVFDGNICVGAGVFDGNFPFAFPAATDDPLTSNIDGFVSGNTIEYRLYQSVNQVETNSYNLTYVLGNGVFQSQGTEAFFIDGTSIIPLTADVQVLTEINCYGGNNGSLEAIAINGLPPYNFLWSNGNTTATVQYLTAGTYSVTVSDATSNSVVLEYNLIEPTNLNVSANIMDVICPGGNDGSISVAVNGATPPYSFTWSNQESSAQIDQLSGGIYSVIIVDANNCSWDSSFVVNEPDSLINGLPILYLGADTAICESESIVLNPGGFASYLWSDGSINSNLEISEAGVYSLTVLDALGCEFTDEFALIVNPLPDVQLFPFASICQGESFVFTPLPNPQFFTSFQWSTGETTEFIEVNTTGTYSVTVSNSFGCENSDEAELIVNPLPVIDLGADQTICEGDVASFSAGTFAAYAWSNGETNSSIEVSTAGVYSVTVTDANGCENSDEAD